MITWHGKKFGGKIQQIMNLKRVIGISTLVFLSVLIASIIGAKLVGVDLEVADPANLPLAMWLVGILSSAALCAGGTLWLFKLGEIVPSARNGFLCGLVAGALGFVLDWVALIPHRNGLNILLKYFTRPEYWTAFILIPIACALVGYLSAKK